MIESWIEIWPESRKLRQMIRKVLTNCVLGEHGQNVIRGRNAENGGIQDR
jgi:hypothetical protein